MKHNQNSAPNVDARIFMFSLRNLRKEVYRCAAYEFEDLICEIDDVFLSAPKPYYSKRPSYSPASRFVRELNYRFKRKFFFRSDGEKIRLKKNYDYFFYYRSHMGDMQQLSAIEGWKEKFRTKICWIEEIWKNDIHKHQYHLRILANFDHVIVNFFNSLTGFTD